MENITSTISVLVDTHDKEMANDILKDLGLNMSTFVNMAIKQLLYTNKLPFEVKNKETNNQVTINEHYETKKNEEKNNNYDLFSAMPNLNDYINNN